MFLKAQISRLRWFMELSQFVINHTRYFASVSATFSSTLIDPNKLPAQNNLNKTSLEARTSLRCAQTNENLFEVLKIWRMSLILPWIKNSPQLRTYTIMEKIIVNRLRQIDPLIDWNLLSSNPALPLHVIYYFPQKSWDWKSLSANPNLPFHLVSQFPEKSWDWKALSTNPKLSFELVSNFPNKP